MMAIGKAFGRGETANRLSLMRARMFLAGLLVLSMSLSGLAGALARTAAPGLTAQISCLDGAGSGENSGKVRHDAACCIVCAVDGLDEGPSREALPIAADTRTFSLVAAASGRAETSVARQIGWLSAWSSRAPPAQG